MQTVVGVEEFVVDVSTMRWRPQSVHNSIRRCDGLDFAGHRVKGTGSYVYHRRDVDYQCIHIDQPHPFNTESPTSSSSSNMIPTIAGAVFGSFTAVIGTVLFSKNLRRFLQRARSSRICPTSRETCVRWRSRWKSSSDSSPSKSFPD